MARADWNTIFKGNLKVKIIGIGTVEITNISTGTLSYYFMHAYTQKTECSLYGSDIMESWEIKQFSRRKRTLTVKKKRRSR